MVRERFIDLPHDVLPPLIVGEVSARDWKAWLEPRSGDLIHDAEYFYGRASELGGNETARNARAAIILGVAAIEAVSNDALVSIYELMIDTWPSECLTLEPWRSFRGRSDQPVARLLRRGSLPEKIRYLLKTLRRLTGDEITDLESNLRKSVQARNRILHMTYLWTPNKARPVLNVRQALHLAKIAAGTAREYIDSLAYTFDEIKLPIRTIREREGEPF
jgi:hypothetical protein